MFMICFQLISISPPELVTRKHFDFNLSCVIEIAYSHKRLCYKLQIKPIILTGLSVSRFQLERGPTYS